MNVAYRDDLVTLHSGDCLDVLRDLPDNSVDAVITDPPYELGFMGRAWDASGIAYNVNLWRECLRVLRPGGHLAAFGGTRTYHRMACAVEDAGFEIRDGLTWLYGSGFPKSRNVGHDLPEWQGWGTALKPAHEPIVLARKPLSGTVAANVLLFGTGALNIDASRVAADWSTDPNRRGWQGGNSKSVSVTGNFGNTGERVAKPNEGGRWPANVLLTHAPDCDDSACQPGCPVSELDAQSGPVHTQSSASRNAGRKPSWSPAGAEVERVRAERAAPEFGDVPGQGASRFFPSFRYQAKAGKAERPKVDDVAHSTVKPIAVMSWLVKLLTPPGGTVLEPFAGSGTTVEACIDEGFHVIAVEREAEYLPLIQQRIDRANQRQATQPAASDPGLFDLEPTEVA